MGRKQKLLVFLEFKGGLTRRTCPPKYFPRPAQIQMEITPSLDMMTDMYVWRGSNWEPLSYIWYKTEHITGYRV